MKINIILKKYQMNANIDFRMLKIQLNFKLKWKFYLRQIEAKLINKYNVINIIEDFM